VRKQIRDLDIKVADPMLPVSSLSGGNQQKVVLGNWLNTRPKVMLFDEPTRGVDVQAKQQIFEIIWRQAEEGLAVVFVSSELEELLEVTDRILVMRMDGSSRRSSPRRSASANSTACAWRGRPDERRGDLRTAQCGGRARQRGE
jgi:ABC-type sugar transport system ATPase subunit